MNRKVTAIILGGGKGERIDARVPKQFLELNGKPLILYAIERFESEPLISDIVVVACSSGERISMPNLSA